MAQTENEPERPRRGRSELIAALAAARSGIGRDARETADLVNVRKRIRATFSDAPLAKATTAFVAGLVGSRLLSGKPRRSKGSSRGWFQRIFPNFDLRKMLRILLDCYLEPGKVDLAALLRERLRELMK